MINNAQKAIVQVHSTPNIFITFLMILCGVAVIYLLGIY